MVDGGRRRKGAFSFLEVLLGFAILASVMAALFYSFMGASRQAHEVEARLKEAMLAQMILDRMQDRIRINDYAFQQKVAGADQTYWGSVVCLKEGKDALPVNPFLQYLFTLDEGPLYVDAKRDSLTQGESGPPGPAAPLREADLSQLAFAYKNFACRVTVRDADLPAAMPGTPSKAQLKELLKDVVIEVHRLDEMRAGRKEPAFRLATKVICPTVSLSDRCFLTLEEAFETEDYDKRLKEIYEELGAQEAFVGYDDLTKEIVANLFMILQEVNSEAFVIEGSIGPAIGGEECITRSLTEWIMAFRARELLIFKKELVTGYEQRAVIIMRHFRRLSRAFERLFELHGPFEQELDDVVRQLAQAALAAAESGATFTRVDLGGSSVPDSIGGVKTSRIVRVLTTAQVIKELLAGESYLPLYERLDAYAVRFAGNLALAQEAVQEVLVLPALTPNAKVLMEKKRVEVLKARILFDYGIKNKQDSTLSLEKQYKPSFLSFSEYFGSEEIRDVKRLERRNKRYLEYAGKMKALLPESNWSRLIRKYKEGGKIANYLATYCNVEGNVGLSDGALSDALSQNLQNIAAGMESYGANVQVKIDSEITRVMREGVSGQ